MDTVTKDTNEDVALDRLLGSGLTPDEKNMVFQRVLGSLERENELAVSRSASAQSTWKHVLKHWLTPVLGFSAIAATALIITTRPAEDEFTAKGVGYPSMELSCLRAGRLAVDSGACRIGDQLIATVSNALNDPITVVFTLTSTHDALQTETVDAALAIDGNAKKPLAIALDSTVQPGHYELRATFKTSGDEAVLGALSASLQISPGDTAPLGHAPAGNAPLNIAPTHKGIR